MKEQSGRNCPTKKVRFRDKIAAQLALARAVQKATDKRRENSVYRCNRCLGWHLTSKPPKGRTRTGINAPPPRTPSQRPAPRQPSTATPPSADEGED